jgi:hypothetical protein
MDPEFIEELGIFLKAEGDHRERKARQAEQKARAKGTR